MKRVLRYLFCLNFILLSLEIFAIEITGDETISIENFEKVEKSPFLTSSEQIKNDTWYKLPIHNKSDENWVLEFVDFRIDNLEIFIPTNNFKTWNHYLTGDRTNFSTRSIYHKNFVFNLPKGKDQQYDIYFKAPSHVHSDFVLRVNLRTHNNFSEYGFSEYGFLCFFYGILFCIALYNLFHFLFTREYIHLYYVGYVLTLSLFSLSRIDGLGFQYIWPRLPGFNSISFGFSLGLFIASSLGFATHFLQLKVFHPKFYRLLITYAILRVLISIISVVGLYLPDIKLIDLCVLIFLFVLGLRKELKKNSSIRFFLQGYSVMILGFSVYILQDFDIIPHSFVSYYSLNFGVILETILLSIALSEKAKTIILEKQMAQKSVIQALQHNDELQEKLISELMEKESLKDKVNRELAERVKERTLELETKNQLLKEQNEKIEKLASQIDIQYYSLRNEAQKKELQHIWNKHVSYDEFLKLYPTEISCLKYLEKQKWTEQFNCVKCGYEHFVRNPSNLSRKCNKCSHIDSVTANTIYHGIHIPIQKAMYIAHCVTHGMENVNVSQFAKSIDLRLNTCRNFIEKASNFIKKNT